MSMVGVVKLGITVAHLAMILEHSAMFPKRKNRKSRKSYVLSLLDR